MLDSTSQTSRPWRTIADEVSREQDPAKLSMLVEELNRALDEQGLDGKPKPTGTVKWTAKSNSNHSSTEGRVGPKHFK
jgi:hypothetical protein